MATSKKLSVSKSTKKPSIKTSVKKAGGVPSAKPVTIARTQNKELSTKQKRILMTPDIMDQILIRHSAGEAIYKICSGPSMPGDDAFFEAVAKNPEYAAAYNRSLGRRAERFADDLSTLSDEARGETAEEIQAIKLQVNTRQWIVSRLLPKKYGERVVVAGDAENPLVTKLVLGADDLVNKLKGRK